MARQSLQASTTGLEKATVAFKRKGWTQEYLAGTVGCTRQLIINFFARRQVEKRFFIAICESLEIEWGKVAQIESTSFQGNKPSNLDELVTCVREIIKQPIQEKYGVMRVLDMSEPIGLDDIYTTVNIFEKIIGRRRLELEDLLKLNNAQLQDYEGLSWSTVAEKRISGLEVVERYKKIMILGKPGAGKTTFLKYLATQCVGGVLQVDLIPIFISLKDFAENDEQLSMPKYLQEVLSDYGVSPNLTVRLSLRQTLLNWNETSVEQLLREGRLLVLLDGLDEVREEDSKRVVRQIRDFAARFGQNQFIVTCRIAAQDYTFEQFAEVEVADFDNEQIKTFSNKWFQARNDFVKAERFTQSLEKDSRIRELATNPLLLTLLCLVFEESGSFPQNRAELYKEGLEVLLKKWDCKRNIERQQFYKKLSLQRKEDLLSDLAFRTFDQGDYLFKQQATEERIAQYIHNLPKASDNLEELELDSEAILKSIEAQHGLLIERARGIYSFSHLTFHEYFTAKQIIASNNPTLFERSLRSLVSHMNEKRWREVFLLTVGMLHNADYLLQLMKQHTDSLAANDGRLQQFLAWVNEKSCSIHTTYKPAATRAFYLTLDLNLDRDLARALDRDLALTLVHARDLALALNLNINLALALNLTLTRALNHALDLTRDRGVDCALDRARDLNLALNHARDLNRALNHARARDRDPEFQRSLKDLKEQLPNFSEQSWENLEQWWGTNGTTWTEQLRAVMIKHRNIGHDWQFSDEQEKLLQQYYDANKLLIDCLNSECYVSREVRDEIEGSLLLPIESLE